MKRNLLFNPGPATTSQSVKMAQVVPDICPREVEFGGLISSLRKRLVKLADGNDRDHSCVMLTASGTGGVESALTGLLTPNAKYLVLINGAYGYRMRDILSAYKIPFAVWEMAEGEVANPAEFERQLLLHSGITHVAVVHHETSTGLMNPVKELATVCRQRGLHLIVDAMSSFGVENLSMEKDGFAAIISSSNKCVQGMAGLTFIIAKVELLKMAVPVAGSFYLNLADQWRAIEKGGQFRFTPPVQVMYALNQAMDELDEETQVGRKNRYHANWQRMIDGMVKLGFSVTYGAEYQSKILAVFNEPDWAGFSFSSMHDYLYEHGITIYPGKLSTKPTFRLSVLGDLHAVDIDALIAKIRLYKQSLGLA